MVYDLEEECETEPYIPDLKNRDERKLWVKNYKDWGLWYRDAKIDVKYYKFDFPDGSRIVVKEYPGRTDRWRTSNNAYYHIIPHNGKIQHQEASETELIDFLTKIRKEMK